MAPDGGTGLSRTSSLVISSPTKSSTPGKRLSKVVDVVPNSEGEREGKASPYKGGIIDLSSESDGGKDKEDSNRSKEPPTCSDPFLGSPKKMADASIKLPTTVIEENETEDDSDAQPHYFPKAGASRRMVVTDSDIEQGGEGRSDGENGPEGEPATDADDGAILVVNDPPCSRRPAPRHPDFLTKLKQRKPPVEPIVHPTPSGGQRVFVDPSLVRTPDVSRSKVTPGTQTRLPDFFKGKGKSRRDEQSNEAGGSGVAGEPSPTTLVPPTLSPAKPTPKRRTKKVLEQEKQAHLAAYAQDLFDDLNTTVFKGRLPKDTPLIWNKRLLATAGRAKWRRDSKGVVTTCIELATKVLDCEERIRNTLSHEMCHLACWVINCNPKENHGGVWRGWVEELMGKRPDIVITTKHTYDIQYKFEWQCQTPTCKKIYGRFSKSIDPEQSICGTCKKGELLPLFQKRTRKTRVVSKLAATNARDSPISGSARPAGFATPTPTRLKTTVNDTVILVVSDSDSDRESLSGQDTDTGDGVIDSKKDTPVTSRPETPRGGDIRRGRQNETGTEDVRRLTTHMSIIDLTVD